MSAEFITTDYEFSHGKKPRGVGTWAFTPGDYAWPGNTMPKDGIAWAWGSYTDAKRDVMREWPAVTYWRVLP